MEAKKIICNPFMALLLLTKLLSARVKNHSRRMTKSDEGSKSSILRTRRKVLTDGDDGTKKLTNGRTTSLQTAITLALTALLTGSQRPTLFST